MYTQIVPSGACGRAASGSGTAAGVPGRRFDPPQAGQLGVELGRGPVLGGADAELGALRGGQPRRGGVVGVE